MFGGNHKNEGAATFILQITFFSCACRNPVYFLFVMTIDFRAKTVRLFSRKYKVNAKTGCHEWKASLTKCGYGQSEKIFIPRRFPFAGWCSSVLGSARRPSLHLTASRLSFESRGQWIGRCKLLAAGPFSIGGCHHIHETEERSNDRTGSTMETKGCWMCCLSDPA
jgi:hypothetical protein